MFVDAYAPGQALFDTHLQAIELLRDHSHVRDYSCAQWLDSLARARFAIDSCRTWRLRMDFPVWIARMRTPEENVKAIRALQNAASRETKTHFAIEPDGSFHARRPDDRGVDRRRRTSARRPAAELAAGRRYFRNSGFTAP